MAPRTTYLLQQQSWDSIRRVWRPNVDGFVPCCQSVDLSKACEQDVLACQPWLAGPPTTSMRTSTIWYQQPGMLKSAFLAEALSAIVAHRQSRKTLSAIVAECLRRVDCLGGAGIGLPQNQLWRCDSGDTNPCRMTGVTLRGVVSPRWPAGGQSRVIVIPEAPTLIVADMFFGFPKQICRKGAT